MNAVSDVLLYILLEDAEVIRFQRGVASLLAASLVPLLFEIIHEAALLFGG